MYLCSFMINQWQETNSLPSEQQYRHIGGLWHHHCLPTEPGRSSCNSEEDSHLVEESQAFSAGKRNKIFMISQNKSLWACQIHAFTSKAIWQTCPLLIPFFSMDCMMAKVNIPPSPLECETIKGTWYMYMYAYTELDVNRGKNLSCPKTIQSQHQVSWLRFEPGSSLPLT